VQGETGGNSQAGVLELDQSTRGGFGVSGTSTTGTALAVAGKVTFSRSGAATVAAGKTSVTVTVAGSPNRA
jgi:hypothetical protein